MRPNAVPPRSPVHFPASFFQRAAAAFFAIAERCSGVIVSMRTFALAFPPFFPSSERYFEIALFFVAIPSNAKAD